MTTDSTFTPKTLSASEYVLALFEPTDNVAVLARNRRTGQTVQRITTAETVASPEFQSSLRRENSAGADIFIGMNPIKDGAYSRTKDSIREIRHLYLDLDTNGREAVESIRNSPEVPAPNFVLDTSPGKHQVVWRVEGIDQEQTESMLRALADQFGGDPAATDSTRVLRLPGFANMKYEEEFIVHAHHESNQVYHARDFIVQEDSPETPRYLGDESGRRLSQGHKSQSEQDWAYAKRALARGDDPALVIQRIADFRADDKQNPEYYAQHTVAKARAQLEKSNDHVQPEIAEGIDVKR
ncbi:MAG TPA: DNA-primase RepB domain-containing protein [Candidatus Acidoferrales bacterium]|nr:DNA-primase RepB domain-containing protein [Candidatus Acidoferrales bacterium]HEV3482605.1 DNA-primase RepB domain-containing protein [Candidatus Acidoferrales bacterium]